MSDFVAGYLSGAASIVIGNPLDVVKVRLQSHSHHVYASAFRSAKSYVAGLPAPILTYGVLNGILFAVYNRSVDLLSGQDADGGLNMSPPAAHFFAGTAAGFATFVVSAPTEYIKCRAQIAATGGSTSESPRPSGVIANTSWAIARQTIQQHGVGGLYRGGIVTSVRDAVGYGFYFWSYEASKRLWQRQWPSSSDALQTLLCGGIAGIATWTSVFPLDAIKTRVQTQVMKSSDFQVASNGAWAVAKQMYRKEGMIAFWRGLGVCNLRAFIVNGVQWSVYEWAMRAFGEPCIKAS